MSSDKLTTMTAKALATRKPLKIVKNPTMMTTLQKEKHMDQCIIMKYTICQTYIYVCVCVCERVRERERERERETLIIITSQIMHVHDDSNASLAYWS